MELFQHIIDEARDEAGAAQKAALSDFAFAIYGVLDEDELPRAGEPEIAYNETRKDLATLIQENIEPSTSIKCRGGALQLAHHPGTDAARGLRGGP